MNSTSAATVPTEWVGVSSRGRVYQVVSCVFFCTAFVTVALRLWARMRQFGRLFADDYFCIIAQVIGLGLMTEAIIFTDVAGMGWHLVDLPPSQALTFFKLFYAAEITYGLVNPFYKLAVIFLYRRIFAEVRAFSIASWVMAGISVAWGFGGVMSSVFQCTPIPRAWDKTIPGHCVNIQAYILGNGIANLLIDAIIILMPLPMIWRLHLDVKRKIALSGMFLLGSIVCVASILRITNLVPLDFEDATYTLVGVAVWSEIEPAVGIIGACLPTLRQFFFSSTAAHSASVSRFTFSSRGNKSSNDDDDSKSTAKSDTAVALTGWKSSSAYTEVKSSNSGFHTPSKYDIESNDDAARDAAFPGNFDFGTVDKSKSIMVNKEISVRYDA